MTARKGAAKQGAAKQGAAKQGAAKKGVARPGAAKEGVAKPGDVKAPRAGARRYWLLKTEPDVFSFDDLLRAPNRTTYWDGVRNYQARNFLRDDMKPGDGVLIYHSGGDEPGVAGIAEVVREGYPDHTAFDPGDPHHDPKSDPAAPTWMMVDVRAVAPLPRPVALAELRGKKGLESMVLLQRGSRLSVQPVTAAEWKIVTRLGGVGD